MKKISILNGLNDDRYEAFETDLKRRLDDQGGTLTYDFFNLRKMNIQYCCGCWNCWLKTPGLCSQKDDMPRILKSVIHSDLTLMISPIVMGFVSSHLKKVNDKMIPMVHPYIIIDKWECHHRKRYTHYPKMGLILLDDGPSKPKSADIIKGVYERLALNLKSDLFFSVQTGENAEEAAYAISHI